ncbi:VEFS-Box of polycomb protein-domain-containing protein [Tribonema minus]|uniref:VEFS-Box of polycomb protein-domain-containing protein n=1 Tax=Tribonema minus TaxID=303371 RepID=A0A835ZER1_9STRA|nr:VEFS-Box of polycomb protein-domain-containing protein [Tribonema minus]
MREDEMDIDSDDDVDSSWLLQQNARLIDEYEDVSAEEKAFMKLWNMHTRAFETPSDSSVPLSCAVFARRFAPALLQRGLRANFVLHLFNLWDNCLVSPKHIHACMAIVNNAEQRLLRTDGGGGGGGAGA